MPGVRFVCLDTADWQDCTKAPQISTLPQIPLLRGKSGETRRQSEGLKADRERRLKNKRRWEEEGRGDVHRLQLNSKIKANSKY